MVPVARRNLFAEKARFAISIAGVAFAVLLILIVLALYRGFSRSGQTFERLPGQLWVVQQGTTDPFHSVSLVHRSDLAELQQTDGVGAIVPVLSRTMEFTVDGHAESARLIALEVDPALALPSDTRSRFLPAPGRFVIDDTFSRKTGLDAGDNGEFAGSRLVVDHVEPASGEAFIPFVFVNFEDAQRIFGVGDLVNYGMVILTDTSKARNVQLDIEGRNAGLHVFTSAEFARAVRKEIDDSFIPIIAVLLVIGFVVGAAVVGLTIYTATIERSREFGVMKAVGASSGFLYRIVLSQSAMLTVAGFILGLVAAWALAQLVRVVVPDFVTEFRVEDIVGVIVATGFMAVLASFVPVRRLTRIDPAMVFKA